MASIEITAKNLDDATKQAAEQLGVAAKELKVTVLEQTKGLFGKGSVRILAETEDKPAKAPAKAKGKTAKAVVEAPSEPEAESDAAPEPEPVPAPEAKPARGRGRAKAEPAPEAEPATAPKGRGRAKAVEPAEPAAEGDETAVVASAEDETFIVDLTTKLLESAQLDAHVASSSRSGKYVSVVLDGRDVAHLVGKHGEVINALQYLVNVIVTNNLRNGVRATLDGNNYRTRREEALTRLATQIGAEVKRRQEEAVLDALPAFERRIVHKALANVEGITTYSEGEEPNRRVVIAPSE